MLSALPCICFGCVLVQATLATLVTCRAFLPSTWFVRPSTGTNTVAAWLKPANLHIRTRMRERHTKDIGEERSAVGNGRGLHSSEPESAWQSPRRSDPSVAPQRYGTPGVARKETRKPSACCHFACPACAQLTSSIFVTATARRPSCNGAAHIHPKYTLSQQCCADRTPKRLASLGGGAEATRGPQLLRQRRGATSGLGDQNRRRAPIRSSLELKPPILLSSCLLQRRLQLPALGRHHQQGHVGLRRTSTLSEQQCNRPQNSGPRLCRSCHCLRQGPAASRCSEMQRPRTSLHVWARTATLIMEHADGTLREPPGTSSNASSAPLGVRRPSCHKVCTLLYT